MSGPSVGVTELMHTALIAVHAFARPENWNDPENPEQAEAWTLVDAAMLAYKQWHDGERIAAALNAQAEPVAKAKADKSSAAPAIHKFLDRMSAEAAQQPQPQADALRAARAGLAALETAGLGSDARMLALEGVARDMRDLLKASPQPQASVGSDAGDLERAIAAARQATKHYFEPTTDVLRRAISSALALRDLLAALDAQAPQPQALCSNCDADGACMKRQALCAFTGKPTQSQASPQASAEDVGAMDRLSYRKSLDAVAKYHELHAELGQALKGHMNIRIPTDAMEQEFANHYRRGFEDGRKQIPESLLEIARRLAADRKQNDHYTADPIYTVQRESRIYHVNEDDATGFIWVEDGERCPEDFATRLERRYKRDWQIPDRFYRCGYIIRWEFVDAYLSYDAAKERVEYENRKHNGLHRTYVESGCRNHEWKALQAWLLQIVAQQTPKKEPT